MSEAAIAGGSSLLGSYLGYKGVKDTNKANIASAREQMAFQERMSGTAYSRAMRDMRRAGLNPMLAYQQGGASSPGGAMPVLQNPMQYAATGLQTLGQDMASTAKTYAEVDKLETGVEKLKQDTEFQKILHNERWPRMFSTMSKENVIASMVAAYYQVPMEDILKGFPDGMMPKEKKALLEMYDELQAAGSFIQKEGAGALSLARAATEAMERQLKKWSTQTMEGARKIRDAVKSRWDK